ncbi:hypothetical protein [Arenibaculum pallidiluteum]|uniref:hypothetical protein n=1 Tax=Arenibaculum pallidiluteum TaxID=2812559 RepID=UPI001A95739B|nr:hypothetical protein [Arenibaculum pallidiluteum]
MLHKAAVYGTRNAGASTVQGAGHGVTVTTGTHRRVSWGALFAGVVLALALQLLLSLLGVGVGLSTIDPTQAGGTPAASSLGIGAGIWWTLSYMVSLAAGGYVAARLAGVVVKGDGMIHGVLTWALALMVSAYLLTSALGTVASRTAGMLGSVAGTATEALQQAAPQATSALPSADRLRTLAGDLLRPGDQPQGGDAQSRMMDALGRIVTGGAGAQQAREEAITVIAEQARVGRDVAAQRVQQVEDQVRQLRGQAAGAAGATTDTLSAAGIGGFVALVLGALAALFGGRAGTRNPEDVVRQ